MKPQSLHINKVIINFDLIFLTSAVKKAYMNMSISERV